jgi:hypothetical protein
MDETRSSRDSSKTKCPYRGNGVRYVGEQRKQEGRRDDRKCYKTRETRAKAESTVTEENRNGGIEKHRIKWEQEREALRLGRAGGDRCGSVMRSCRSRLSARGRDFEEIL